MAVINKNDTNNVKHTFELSGLGKPPFEVVHPKQNALDKGHTFWCEHCGTILKNRHFIKSSDGIISIVGIDCLKKTGDAGLIDGVKRLAREQRAQERENQVEFAQKQRLLKERETNNGLSNAELASTIQCEIENRRQAFIEDNEDNAIIKSFTKIGFEKAMVLQFYSIEPYTHGQLSAIKKVYTKKVSKARLNSKRYKEAFVACSTLADDLQQKLMLEYDEIRRLREKIIYLKNS